MREERIDHLRDLGALLHHIRGAVHAFEKEGFYFRYRVHHRGAELHNRRTKMANIFDALWIGIGQCGPRLVYDIGDHRAKYAAQGLMAATIRVERGYKRSTSASASRTNGRWEISVSRNNPAPQSVMQIVIVIGDVIGQSGNLRLGTGKCVQVQVVALRIAAKAHREAARGPGRYAWRSPQGFPKLG